MYRVGKRNAKAISEAHNLALVQFALLRRQRTDIAPEDFATSFLAREVLRLYQEGDRNPQRLATRAVGCLRDHIQKKESALRLARPAEPD